MSWWVIPEGTAGQIVSDISHDLQSGGGPAGVGSFFTVTQAAAKPSGAAAGPFSTKAEAQAKASALNGNVTAATQPSASNLTGLAAIGDFFHRLTQAGTWERVAEIVIGGLLIIVGLAKLASGTSLGRAAASIGTKAALL